MDGEPDAESETRESLTYSAAGVDIEASEDAAAALINAVDADIEGYAGLLDIGDRYLALSTDGVGTKLLVAEALGDYSTVGIDCIAMNANDMVASGVEPVAFVDYLAVDEPDDEIAEQIGEGLAAGAEEAGIALVGGETAVMPEVIDGLDLAGTCAGLAPKNALFDGDPRPGDALVGWASSGIHSNGLTLAREAVRRDHTFADPVPGEDGTIGEALLRPTRLYTHLLSPLRAGQVRAAAHITGGGWTNLKRLGDVGFDVTDPFPVHPVFDLIQRAGNVTDREMHRTFNMGTGFVAAVPTGEADDLATATDGKVIGAVTDGSGVSIRGLSL